MYSSPLVQDLSLLPFKWFRNAFFSWAQSLQGWDASLPFFPCLAGNESPCSFFASTLYPSFGFSYTEHPDICPATASFLFMCQTLSFFTAVFSFRCGNYCGLQTAKADWWIHSICWLENCLGREGSLGLEANAVRSGEGIWGCKQDKV